MSSWSLVLWRPPPHSARAREPEPRFSLNPHAAKLLERDSPPPPLPLPVRPPSCLSPLQDQCMDAEPPVLEAEPPIGEPETEAGTEVEAMDVDPGPAAPIEPDERPAAEASEPDPQPDTTEPVQPDPDTRPETPSTPRLGLQKRPAPDAADARTLRRPFRAPRVVLKRKPSSSPPLTPDRAVRPEPPASPRSAGPRLVPRAASPSPPSKSLASSKHEPYAAPSNTSLASPRSTARTKRARFKPPGPASSSESSRSSRSRRGPDAELLAALEARLRTLRQAASCSEDDHVVGLIAQWRAAGREVTERLYAMIPPPDDEPRVRRGGWGWGWDEPAGEGLSEDQHRYLREECRVLRGEIVDHDDRPLFGEEESLDDVLRGGGGEGRRPRRIETEEVQRPAEPEVWNRGAMLGRLGVDPALLGYNAEEDDWDEVDDD